MRRFHIKFGGFSCLIKSGHSGLHCHVATPGWQASCTWGTHFPVYVLPPAPHFLSLGLLPHSQWVLECAPVKWISGTIMTAFMSPGSRGPGKAAAYVAEQWPQLQSDMVAHECPGLTQYWCQRRCHCQMPWQRAGPRSWR